MHGKWRVLTLVAVLLALSTGNARGEIIRIDLVGEVTDLDDREDLFGGTIDVGDTVTASYVYTTDFTSGYGESEYQTFMFTDPFGFSLVVGEFEFQSEPGNVSLHISIGDDYQSTDRYSVQSHNNVLVGSDAAVDAMQWYLVDYTLSAFSNSALPSTAPNIEDFQGNSLYLACGDRPPTCLLLTAEVTSATATVVPELCTFVLLGTGSLFLVRRRKG